VVQKLVSKECNVIATGLRLTKFIAKSLMF